MKEVQVAEGLKVQGRKGETWLCFEANGKHASICIESNFEKTRIVRSAILSWCNQMLTSKK